MKQFNISVAQLVTILILSRVYTILTFTSYEDSLLTTILAVWVSVPLQLICLTPALLLFKQSNYENLLDYTMKQSKLLYYVWALFLMIFFIFMSIYIFTTFEDFLTTTMYSRQGTISLTLPIIICAFLSLHYGMTGLLKMASISAAFIAVTTFLILCLALPDGSFYNIRPVIQTPLKTLGYSSLFVTLRNFELIPLLYIGLKVKEHVHCAIKRYLYLSTLIITFILFTILYVLGDYVRYQIYPLYALTSFVDFSIFQRLDSLYAIIWIVAAFAKVSFYLLLGVDVLKRILPKSLHRYVVPTLFVIILFATLLKDNYYTMAINHAYYFALTVIFFITLVVLPLIIYGVTLLKRRRKSHG